MNYETDTLRIPGNVGFGPLDENAAIFGATTCSPSIVYAGEIFTSGTLFFYLNNYIIDYSSLFSS
jgi:hypothetical protein